MHVNLQARISEDVPAHEEQTCAILTLNDVSIKGRSGLRKVDRTIADGRCSISEGSKSLLLVFAGNDQGC